MNKNKFKYYDSILPNQKFLKKYYEGGSKNYYKNLFKLTSEVSNVKLPTKEFIIKNKTKFSIAEMASNPVILKFYTFLINSNKIKSILEIGSFIGYSSMYMAKNSSRKVKITSIEKYKFFYEIAKENIRINKLSKQINLINNDAEIELSNLIKKKQKFDLFFLDGDKGRYLNLFKKIEKLLKKDSIVIVDNVYFQGDLINKSTKTDKGKGVKKLLNYLKQKKVYDKSLLPAYDGILFIRKL